MFIRGPSGLSPSLPGRAFHDCGAVAGGRVGFGHRPGDAGCAIRYAAVDLLTVEFEDLRPAGLEPLLGARDALPAHRDQGIGKGIRLDLVLGVVRYVSRGLGHPDRITLRVGARDADAVVGIRSLAGRRRGVLMFCLGGAALILHVDVARRCGEHSGGRDQDEYPSRGRVASHA